MAGIKPRSATYRANSLLTVLGPSILGPFFSFLVLDIGLNSVFSIMRRVINFQGQTGSGFAVIHNFEHLNDGMSFLPLRGFIYK